MSKHGMKRLWAAAFLLTAAIIITGSGYNRIKTRTSDTENSKIPPSSKEAVLNLETRGKNKIQAGNRETMNRLAVTENGSIIFAMEKVLSENQEDFEEWYITSPYKNKQLVNVSDLYAFLEHYAAWDYLNQAENVEFRDSGLAVEESFTDSGTVRFLIGQKNKKGNYYVKEERTGRLYEIDGTQTEAMTGLKPYDFIMGIANLVYLTTVDKLEIRTQETAAVFLVETDEDRNQVFIKEGQVLEEDGFKKMYSSIISIVAAKEAEDSTASGQPVLQLSFSRNTDKLKNTQISYIPYNEEYYLIIKDGQSDFLAEKSAVDEVIAVIDEYCR